MKTVIIAIILVAFSITAGATEKKIITSDGVELHVKIEGKGTPCLYIHGGPGSGSFWLEEFFGDFLEENFTMIYLDQRGVGRSTSPANGDFSLNRLALDFEEVRKELGYESWLTLGHSFGGILQMGYAENFPETNKGMLMINCTLNLVESFCESWDPKATELLGDTTSFSCTGEPQVIMQRMNELGNRLREKSIFWKMAYSEEKSEEAMNETYKSFTSWNYDYGNAALAIPDYWKNFKVKAPRTQQPVLFFYGTNDWMVGPEHYKGVNFPQMLMWKSEGGHVPFQEDQIGLKKAILSYKEKYNF